MNLSFRSAGSGLGVLKGGDDDDESEATKDRELPTDLFGGIELAINKVLYAKNVFPRRHFQRHIYFGKPIWLLPFKSIRKEIWGVLDIAMKFHKEEIDSIIYLTLREINEIDLFEFSFNVDHTPRDFSGVALTQYLDKIKICNDPNGPGKKGLVFILQVLVQVPIKFITFPVFEHNLLEKYDAYYQVQELVDLFEIYLIQNKAKILVEEDFNQLFKMREYKSGAFCKRLRGQRIYKIKLVQESGDKDIIVYRSKDCNDKQIHPDDEIKVIEGPGNNRTVISISCNTAYTNGPFNIPPSRTNSLKLQTIGENLRAVACFRANTLPKEEIKIKTMKVSKKAKEGGDLEYVYDTESSESEDSDESESSDESVSSDESEDPDESKGAKSEDKVEPDVPDELDDPGPSQHHNYYSDDCDKENWGESNYTDDIEEESNVLGELEYVNESKSSHQAKENFHYESGGFKHENRGFHQKCEGSNHEYDGMNRKCESMNSKYEDMNCEYESMNRKYQGMNLEQGGWSPEHGRFNPESFHHKNEDFKREHRGLHQKCEGSNNEFEGMNRKYEGINLELSSCNTERGGCNTGRGSLNPECSSLNPESAGWKPESAGLNPESVGWNPEMAGLNPESASWNPASAGLKPESGRWNPASACWNPVSAGWNPASAGWNPARTGWTPSSVVWNPAIARWIPASAGGWIRANAGWIRASASWIPANPGWFPTNPGWIPTNPGWIPANHGWIPSNTGSNHANTGSNPEAGTWNLQHVILNPEYVSLNKEDVSLNTEHVSLNTEHVSLNTEHVGLNTEHVSLNTEHVGLNTEHVGLNPENDVMKREIEDFCNYVGWNSEHECWKPQYKELKDLDHGRGKNKNEKLPQCQGLNGFIGNSEYELKKLNDFQGQKELVYDEYKLYEKQCLDVQDCLEKSKDSYGVESLDELSAIGETDSLEKATGMLELKGMVKLDNAGELEGLDEPKKDLKEFFVEKCPFDKSRVIDDESHHSTILRKAEEDEMKMMEKQRIRIFVKGEKLFQIHDKSVNKTLRKSNSFFSKPHRQSIYESAKQVQKSKIKGEMANMEAEIVSKMMEFKIGEEHDKSKIAEGPEVTEKGLLKSMDKRGQMFKRGAIDRETEAAYLWLAAQPKDVLQWLITRNGIA